MSKLNPYASFKDSDVFKPGAFNPGLFDTNKQKVKKLYPHAFSLAVTLNGPAAENYPGIAKQMHDGDLSTGVVVSENPLLVACYSEDFDAVALLCYPTALGEKMGWKLGSCLLTVNGYNGYGIMRKNKDLDVGPRGSTKYKTFGPLVADLYTDNMERLARKKREIPQAMWQHTAELGLRYMAAHPGMARSGCGKRFDDAMPIEKLNLNCKLD